MPFAISIGISIDDFWNMTPHVLSIYSNAHNIKAKERDRMNWFLGMYFCSAIASCLSKDAKYVEEPFLEELGMSQEEIDAKALRKMIEAEEQWIRVEKRKGLEETKA